MNLLFTTGNYAALHAQRNAQLDQQAAQMPNTTQQDKVAQWHMSRRHGLSGSQIAAVMGFSKWSTPFNVWSFITGRQSEGSANTAPLEWGHRLEPVIAQKYQDDLGVTLSECPTLQSQQFPFLVGSVDRLVLDASGQPIKVLEIKTASINRNSGEKGEDGELVKQWGRGNVYGPNGQLLVQDSQVPKQYLLQVMHYMILTGLKQADIAVLLTTNDYRVFTIDYDEELAAAMIQAADEFWCKYVLDNVMPPMLECDAKTLTPVKGSEVKANSDVLAAIADYKRLNAQIDELKSQLQSARDCITGYIGANDLLIDDQENTLASYSTCKGRASFDDKRFKIEHPDLYDQYVKAGAPYRRFLVK